MMLGDPRRVGMALGLLVVACDDETAPDRRPDQLGPLDCTGDHCATVTRAAECPPEGWCWVRGEPLRIGGSTQASVYAIGPVGVFLRWDDDGWVSQPVPTSLDLISGEIGPEGDAWAIDASGSAWHLHERGWQQVPAGAPLRNIVRIVGSTVYAVSGGSAIHGTASGGVLLRNDGGAWEQVAPEPSYCLSGDSWVLDTEEIWSAGIVCDDDGGVEAVEVRRFDGSSWVLVGDPIPDPLWLPDLYEHDGRVRVTVQGVFEWDGSAWRKVELEFEGLPQNLPPGQEAVYAQRDQPPVVVPSALGCHGALRLGDRTWCDGDAQIFVEDGDAWRPTLRDAFGATQADAAWGTIPPMLWAGADTRKAWGSDPRNVFRIRESTRKVEHFDGSAWRVLDESEAADVDGIAGCRGAAGDVWLGTTSGLARLDGDAFTQIPSPPDVEDPAVRLVHAVGPGAVVAVFDDGKLYRYESEWSLLFSSTDDFYWWIDSVVSTSPNDVWLVRSRASRPYVVEVHRYDGSAWSKIVDTTGFGRLALRNGEVWLATEQGISRLPDRDVSLPGPPSLAYAPLWFGPDALWITTSSQALRYALP